MKEYKTTEYLRRILQENGVRLLETGLETGLIAVIGTGKSPVVALRADIDALPITEQTNLAYASETAGVMHACGHDFHTTCMLGAALQLKKRETALSGTVKVIFQPAEEVGKVVTRGLESRAAAVVVHEAEPFARRPHRRRGELPDESPFRLGRRLRPRRKRGEQRDKRK